MLTGTALRIAIPSKGRLRDRALDLLEGAGLKLRVEGRRLLSVCPETGIGVIFSNTKDVPVLVSEGVVDVGITGSDVVLEKRVDTVEHRKLGFGRCRLSLAVHRDAPYTSPADLAGRVVGSSFVSLAREFFEKHGARDVHVLEIQGAVEGMVLLGLVDGIVEVVETGNSLVENDLVEIAHVLDAEAVLIGNGAPRDAAALDGLLRRIDGVLVSRRYSVLEYNCPASRIDAATRITPGFSSPTIQQTGDPAWVAVKVLVERAGVHDVMDQLEAIGCAAMLETALRHTRL